MPDDCVRARTRIGGGLLAPLLDAQVRLTEDHLRHQHWLDFGTASEDLGVGGLDDGVIGIGVERCFGQMAGQPDIGRGELTGTGGSGPPPARAAYSNTWSRSGMGSKSPG